MKCENAGHVQNIMQQCKQLLNSLAIQMQILHSQNKPVFFFFILSSNNFFTKSKNVVVKKLSGGVVALENPEN